MEEQDARHDQELHDIKQEVIEHDSLGSKHCKKTDQVAVSGLKEKISDLDELIAQKTMQQCCEMEELERMETLVTTETGVRALQCRGLWEPGMCRSCSSPPHRSEGNFGSRMGGTANPCYKVVPDQGDERDRQGQSWYIMARQQLQQFSGKSDSNSEDNEDDDDVYVKWVSHRSRYRKKHSGMYGKPDVKTRLMLHWPQMNLRFGFIEEPLKFKQLKYEHLVVGEVAMICQCQDQAEKEARLILLDRISYWTLQGAAWPQIQAFYANVISGVETGMVDWGSELHARLGESESMLIDRPALSQVVWLDRVHDGKKVAQSGGSKKTLKPRVWFCAEYNAVLGCTQVSPHPITDQARCEHEAHNICAHCYHQKNQKRNHPQTSDQCPLKA